MPSQAKDVFCIWLVSPLLRKQVFTSHKKKQQPFQTALLLDFVFLSIVYVGAGAGACNSDYCTEAVYENPPSVVFCEILEYLSLTISNVPG